MNRNHFLRGLAEQARKPDTSQCGDRSVGETLTAIEAILRRNLHRLHLLPLPEPTVPVLEPEPDTPRPLTQAGFRDADEVRLAMIRMRNRLQNAER
ncbi:MAG: hypothetical protein Q7P63_04550 [Verrucomicrobiota bacterium JB022]|nr:hypothetical protein [Verrucomicrobiota bacterium JB022]